MGRTLSRPATVKPEHISISKICSDSYYYNSLDRQGKKDFRQKFIKALKSSSPSTTSSVNPPQKKYVVRSKIRTKTTVEFVPPCLGPGNKNREIFGFRTINKSTFSVKENINNSSIPVLSLQNTSTSKAKRARPSKRVRQRMRRRRELELRGPVHSGTANSDSRITRRQAFRGVLYIEGLAFAITNVAAAAIQMGTDIFNVLNRLYRITRISLSSFFGATAFNEALFVARLMAHVRGSITLHAIERYITDLDDLVFSACAFVVCNLTKHRTNYMPSTDEFRTIVMNLLLLQGIRASRISAVAINDFYRDHFDITKLIYQFGRKDAISFYSCRYERNMLREGIRNVLVSAFDVVLSLPFVRFLPAFTRSIGSAVELARAVIEGHPSADTDVFRYAEERQTFWNTRQDVYNEFLASLDITGEDMVDLVVRGVEASLTRISPVTPTAGDEEELIREIDDAEAEDRKSVV